MSGDRSSGNRCHLLVNERNARNRHCRARSPDSVYARAVRVHRLFAATWLVALCLGCGEPAPALDGGPVDAAADDAEPSPDASRLDAGGAENCVDLASLPICGEPVPALDEFSRILQEYMLDHDISAGALGVSKDGVVLLQQGFGWLDRGRNQPTPPDAMFRIASVTKPMTAAAVRHLIAEGTIALDDRVFDLGQPEGGLLEITPFAGLGDARLRDVTVEHLLQHRGGWDRALSGDFTYEEVAIADAMSVPSPPGRTNIARYILSQPLDHEPGSTYAYANLGFMLLGLIVEQVTSEGCLEVVQTRVLAPIGVGPTHLAGARTFEIDTLAWEPWYDGRGFQSVNVFDPMGPLVDRPYGGWHMEARIGQGGLLADTTALLGYLGSYQVAGDGIGTPRAPGANSNWTHTGSLTGTNALATQRSSGVAIALLLNRRATGQEPSYTTELRTLLLDAADRVVDWPTP